MSIRNISESASTIKNMWELLPSDAWTIDKALLYCNYSNTAILQTELILDKYYNYFEQYLIDYKLDSKYFYNPQLFAYDYYGDAGLDFMVLYFSGCTTLFDFKKDTIKILEYSHLKEINKLFTFYQNIIHSSKLSPEFINENKVKKN